MTYSMRHNPSVRSYSFRVKQRNACGASPASDALIVTLLSVVNKIQLLATAADGCTLRFSWSPGSERSQIVAYKLTVRGENGYYELPKCRNALNQETINCDVPYETLSGYPFYLRKGS